MDLNDSVAEALAIQGWKRGQKCPALQWARIPERDGIAIDEMAWQCMCGFITLKPSPEEHDIAAPDLLAPVGFKLLVLRLLWDGVVIEHYDQLVSIHRLGEEESYHAETDDTEEGIAAALLEATAKMLEQEK